MKLYNFRNIVLSISLIYIAQLAHSETADSVYLNGDIFTVSNAQPWAQAVVIKDKRFVFVGANEGARKYIGKDTEVVDLQGKMAMPGLHDAHTHLLWAGQSLLYWCDVPGGPIGSELIAALKECAKGLKKDQWLIAGLYFSEQFPDARPDRKYLDKIFPDTPVFMYESSVHNGLVNSRALEIAGVDESTPAPLGGELIKDDTGRLTGELVEAATALVTGHIPSYTSVENIRALQKAVQLNNEYGITSVQDASGNRELLETLSRLEHDGKLTLDVAVHLMWGSPKFNKEPAAEVDELIADHEKYQSAHVNTDNIKMWLDGTPTGPYFTQADIDQNNQVESERLLIPPNSLNDAVARFDKSGLKVKMHVAGAGAAHAALDAIEYARRRNSPSLIMHDLAHTGLVTEADMDRMRELNVVGEMSPALWQTVGGYLGDPPQRVWQFRTLSDKGVLLTIGTDWVVTPTPNLFPALEGLLDYEDESLDLISAIRALTINGAISTGRGDIMGSIEPGKLANMIVLDRNIFEIQRQEISETGVDMTLFEGHRVYVRKTD